MNATKLLLIILFLVLLGIVSRHENERAPYLPPVSGVQTTDPDDGDYVRADGNSLNNKAR